MPTITMYELGTGRTLEVQYEEEAINWGGEGRILSTKVEEGKPSYCIKAMDGVSPGSAATVVRNLNAIRSEIIERLEKGNLPETPRRTLTNIVRYLPTHTAMKRRENGNQTLFILREYAIGNSLRDVCMDATSMLPIRSRYELTKRLMRQLTGLSLGGFVHLDAFPDNIFVETKDGWIGTLALIDLEGMGVLARDERGAFGAHRDQFTHVPSAYGKEGAWLVPPWYPRPTSNLERLPRPYEDMFVAASRWQALSCTMFAVSGGFRPFNWLENSAQIVLAKASRDGIANVGDVEAAYQRIDPKKMAEIEENTGAEGKIVGVIKRRVENGFLEPRSIPSMRTLQDELVSLMRVVDR